MFGLCLCMLACQWFVLPMYAQHADDLCLMHAQHANDLCLMHAQHANGLCSMYASMPMTCV